MSHSLPHLTLTTSTSSLSPTSPILQSFSSTHPKPVVPKIHIYTATIHGGVEVPRISNLPQIQPDERWNGAKNEGTRRAAWVAARWQTCFSVPTSDIIYLGRHWRADTRHRRDGSATRMPSVPASLHHWCAQGTMEHTQTLACGTWRKVEAHLCPQLSGRHDCGGRRLRDRYGLVPPQ